MALIIRQLYVILPFVAWVVMPLIIRQLYVILLFVYKR
jgi:hypothetical protein